MARVVVTGGAGFVGSNLTEALLRQGHDVRVLDNFSTGRRENLARAAEWAAAGRSRYELIEGDIRDAGTCRSATSGVDFVLHQAAIPSVQRSIRDVRGTHDVNVNGTLNLLEAARQVGVQRFVFASSSSVYGDSAVLPKVETMAPAPISPYALQKLAAETYCVLYHRLFAVPTVALRYFNVFGPRQDPTSEYSAVIPRFIRAALDGARATIYGDGEQSRDFTFVADVVRANLDACAADPAALGRAYNIACGGQTTLNALLAEIGRLTGRDVEADRVAPRAGDVRHSRAGIDAARERLGFRPQVSLVEGLERTIEAY
jgi:nucleoside-diphosphate-sugar epimerase